MAIPKKKTAKDKGAKLFAQAKARNQVFTNVKGNNPATIQNNKLALVSPNKQTGLLEGRQSSEKVAGTVRETPGKPVIPPITGEEKANALLQNEYAAGKTAEQKLFGDTTGASTYEQAQKQKALELTQQYTNAKLSQEQQRKDLALQAGQAQQTLGSNAAAAISGLTTGEGPTSATNLAGISGAQQTLATRTQQLKDQSAEKQRQLAQAEADLNAAYRDGRESLIAQARQNFASAQMAVDQINTNLINAQAAEQEAKTSEANAQSTRGDSIRTAITALGAGAANLSVSQLSAMTEGTNITLPEALLLQQQALAQAAVDSAKNEQEAARAQAELDKINADIGQIGRTSEMQNYEYFSQLSDAGKAQYLQLQQASKGMQLVQASDGSGMYAFDPNNGTIIPLQGQSTGRGAIPHEAPITATIGDKSVTAQPVFMKALQAADAAMYAATGQHIQTNQSYRTYEQQKAIRDSFGYTDDSQPSGYNGLPMAAPPGSSFHENGLAVDVTNWQEAEPYLEAQGIVGGLTNDRGHFSMGEMNPDVFATTDTYIPGANPTVDSWAERIQNGQAKITDIPSSEKGMRGKVVVALSALGNSTDGGATVTEMGKAALKSAQDLLSNFDDGVGTLAVGKSSIFPAFPGTPTADFIVSFKTLKDQLSLDAVSYLKGSGAISDGERALLSSAVSNLDLSQSEPEFRKSLQAIIDKLSGDPAPETTIAPVDPDAAVGATVDPETWEVGNKYGVNP